ncbi:7-carboxy-7-deazaguanine synthase [Escherichia coli]|nr:7-carboxy-7-deazaguanine synthase [Escherichia coli]
MENVITKLMLKGCRKLIITGGEPLLYKDFISLYTFIHQQGIDISLFTNASLMTENILNYSENTHQVLFLSLYMAKIIESFVAFLKIKEPAFIG